MPEHAPDFAAVFLRLERGLLARRLASIEPVLRLEIGALVWQARLRLDTTGFAHGPLAADGSAVLFSSHVTGTIERVCDRVVVLHRGRVVRTLDRADWGATSSGLSTLERAFLDLIGAQAAAATA